MSFANPDSNGFIVQTGTDNDLSDLANNTGVTTTQDAGVTFYDFGNNKLKVYGTVHQDPETEVCIFQDDSTEGNPPGDTVFSINEGSPGSGGWFRNFRNLTGQPYRDNNGGLVCPMTGHPYNVGDALRTQMMNNSNLNNAKIRIDAVTTDTFTIGRGDYYEIPDQNIESNAHIPWGRVARIPCWNYGKEIVQNGRTRYSVGNGLIFSGGSTSNWDPDEYSLSLGGSGFIWTRGGTIISNRPFNLGGTYDTVGTTWASPRKTSGGAYSPVEIRSMGTGFFTKSKLVNVSGIDVRYLGDKNFKLEGGALSEVLGSWWEVSLKDFDVSGNANNVDIGHDGSSSHHHHDYEILNSANGSNIIAMWRPVQRNSAAQRGVVATKKEVSFSVKDASGNPIEGVEMYVVDNPSAFAKKGTFAPGTSQGAYTKTPTLLNGVINDDGSITYDYLDPISYTGTTDSSGVIPTIKVLTSIQIKEYNANHPDSFFPNTTLPEGVTENRYHGEFGYVISKRPNGNWRYSSTNNNGPAFTDWDTDEFGGFYRVDRRSNDNTDADEFTFKFCSYGHSLSSSTQPLRGLGELVVNWTLFDDLVVAESDKSVVDAYTEIETSEKFYDRAKAFLTDNYEGEGATIVSRAGNEIDLGAYNLTVDSNASSVFAFDGSTITIKASAYSGNLTTSGVVTLSNGAVVLGTITDASGTRATLQYSVSGLIQHSRIQLYNVTADTEIFNGSINATTYSAQYTEGTEVTTGDEIRLRVTRQNGVTAYLPFTATAIATAAGFSFKASQLDDLVYNANGIDGSSITTLTADFPNVQVDVDDADGSCDVREIYARYVNIITTEEGIRQWFGGITAINTVNYQVNTAVNDLTIQNVGTNGVNLAVARIFRDDGAIILAQGNAPITQDNGEFVQFIQPQVEAALSPITTNTDQIPAIKKNTDLVPALL